MGYKFTNCRKADYKPVTTEKAEVDLDEGWVGVDKDTLYFKTDRGSAGYALYGTERLALSNTGCAKAMKVKIKIEIL